MITKILEPYLEYETHNVIKGSGLESSLKNNLFTYYMSKYCELHPEVAEDFKNWLYNKYIPITQIKKEDRKELCKKCLGSKNDGCYCMFHEDYMLSVNFEKEENGTLICDTFRDKNDVKEKK